MSSSVTGIQFASQLKPPYLTAPMIFWKHYNVFIPQKTWNFLGSWDSNPAGSYCVEMPPRHGCGQAVTEGSALSNISRSANLRARKTHREQFFIFYINFFWEQFFFRRKLLSISIRQLHFLSISSTVCAGRLLCQAATMNTCLGAPPSLFPVEILFSSAGGTEQQSSSCQNTSLYVYLAFTN